MIRENYSDEDENEDVNDEESSATYRTAPWSDTDSWKANLAMHGSCTKTGQKSYTYAHREQCNQTGLTKSTLEAYDDPREPVTITDITNELIEAQEKIYPNVTIEPCSDTDDEQQYATNAEIQMIMHLGHEISCNQVSQCDLNNDTEVTKKPQETAPEDTGSSEKPIKIPEKDQTGTLQNRPEDLTYPPVMEDLVREYAPMFSGKRGTCNLYEHKFYVKPTFLPSMCKHYELPGKKRAEGKPIIEDWLKDETIRKSDSRYRNPLVGVRKADKTLRLCGDYRILNKHLIVRGDQAPHIDYLKTKFSGAKIFSSLDFNESFLQVKLTEDSMKYTAFLFDGVPYEFTRLPFGTKDSMQGFLAAARCALEGTDAFVAAYVDDILVFSKTPEEHKKHLEIVFRKINAAGMSLKLKKCKFFQHETKFLGFIISSEGIKPDPSKVLPVKNFPTPTCKVDVQSFLGLVNYYRCHIPYCADISQPLARLTGNVEFKWERQEQVAFDKLKAEMCRLLLEAHPDFSRPFYVMTDASKYGIGGFIYQLNDKEEPQVITMVSRLLRAAELNYHTYERELLGSYIYFKEMQIFLGWI